MDKKLPGVEVRLTEMGDTLALKEWLMEPESSRYFPMYDETEVDDAVSRWVGFSRYRCSLTAVCEGKPVGIATLFLQPYRKLAHQTDFGIAVAPERRGQGVGSLLLTELFQLARQFKIELLHLQVYENNPAIRLYRRFGFREFGRQTHWIKEQSDPAHYSARLFMECYLEPLP